MSQPGFEDLQKRLEKLEHQNRRMKHVGAAVLAVVAATMVMGQTPSKKTAEANEFVLKDSAGTVRATLGFFRSKPTLTLIDANGRERASLGTDYIDFDDTNGTQRVSLGSSVAASYKLVEGKAQITDEGPGLIFSGADKYPMMFLRGMSQGASIYLYGEAQSSPN